MRVTKRTYNEDKPQNINELSYLAHLSDIVVIIAKNKELDVIEFCCFTVKENEGRFGCILQDDIKLKTIYDNIKYYYENTSKDIPSQYGFILGSMGGMSFRLRDDVTLFFISKE